MTLHSRSFHSKQSFFERDWLASILPRAVRLFGISSPPGRRLPKLPVISLAILFSIAFIGEAAGQATQYQRQSPGSPWIAYNSGQYGINGSISCPYSVSSEDAPTAVSELQAAIRANCTNVSACQSVTDWSFDAPIKSISGTSGWYQFAGIATITGVAIPESGNPPYVCSSFTADNSFVVSKSCAATIPSRNSRTSRFHLETDQCMCELGSVYVPEANSCVDVVLRKTPQEQASCESGKSTPTFGNPISPLDGQKRESVSLLEVDGMPLRLQYRSALARNSEVLSSATYISNKLPSSGVGWATSWDRRLIIDSKNANGKWAFMAYRGSANWTSFDLIQGPPFVALDPNQKDTLSAIGGGQYAYFNQYDQEVETYDAAGVLTESKRLDGSSWNYVYSIAADVGPGYPSQGLLKSITSFKGRGITFRYSASPSSAVPRLVEVAVDGQVAVSLQYTIRNELAAIAWADGSRLGFLYGSLGQLTGKLNELNTAVGNYSYNLDGDSIGTELAGGVVGYSVGWLSKPVMTYGDTYDSLRQIVWRDILWNPPVGTAVAMPNGSYIGYEAKTVNGRSVISAQSQPAGSGCATASSRQEFTPSGNRDWSEDFASIRTCYLFQEARGLELARVAGLLSGSACASVIAAQAVIPASAIKQVAEWHPNWAVKTKSAGPGRRVSNIYNGQPDPFNGNALASCAPGAALLPDGKPIVVLCKRVEQATTDANGSQGFAAALQAGVASRVWTYTYNQFGQVLTAKGPRSDVDDTTTYTYYSDTTASHVVGDLASSRNALNQTTQYTSYNAAGQLMQMVDPNGVVTDNVYDVRRRLVSTTVAGQATVYTYDLAGQLTRVSLADGSFAGFEYDAAQRQTAVFDNIGNRIEYTLDSSSNRVGERVKDPDGVLRRVLTRSVDALGRVQQVVGRE